MSRFLKPLPVLVLLLSLSGVVGLTSCGSSSDSDDSGDSGSSGGSGTAAGESATCPSTSESAALNSPLPSEGDSPACRGRCPPLLLWRTEGADEGLGVREKNSSWNQSLSLTNGGTGVSSGEIGLTLTATNSNGITGYWLSEDDTTPAASDSGWVEVDETASLSTTASFTLSETDGGKTVYGWFKDTTDEVSPVACLSVTLDASGPTGALSLDSGAASSSDLTVSATITGTSSNSPIVAYALSETNTTPAIDSSVWNTISEPSTSVTITTDFTLSATSGSHTVYGWFKSETGTISNSFSAAITFTLPTVASGAAPVVQEGLTVNENSTLTAGITINSGATFTASRTVSLTLSGLGTADITGYIVSESSTTPAVGDSGWVSVPSAMSVQILGASFQLSATDGAKTVYLYLKDSVNTIASANASITLDGTVPTGSLSLDSGAKLTVDATVSATITGSDSIGVVGYAISSSPSPVPSPSGGEGQPQWVAVTSTTSLSTSINRSLTDLTGLSTQYLWLKDAAGNVSSTLSDGIEVVRVYSTSSTNDIGSYTSIAVDSASVAYISNYRANSGDLFYHTLVNGTLGAGGLDGTGDVGAGTSIAIDSNNKLHIAYRDTTNGNLKYATNASGSWVTEAIEAGGISPSIGIDSNNKIHISHQASNKVRYVTNVGGSWVSQVVLSSGNYGNASSLAVGPNSRIHVVARSSSPAGLHYATNNSGVWVEEVVEAGSNAGFFPSIMAESNGTIVISSDNSGPRIAVGSSNSWSMTQIDSQFSDATSVAIDSQGFIHLVYYDTTTDDLKYATDYSGSWTTQTLDSSGDVGDFCDVAIDSDDRLHISYYDATNGDLKYATTAD